MHDYIADQKGGYLEEREILVMFAQLALALHHVHSHNILHRDLKTTNILISGIGPGKVLKIGDFGISKVLTTKSKAETVIVPISNCLLVDCWYALLFIARTL